MEVRNRAWPEFWLYTSITIHEAIVGQVVEPASEIHTVADEVEKEHDLVSTETSRWNVVWLWSSFFSNCSVELDSMFGENMIWYRPKRQVETSFDYEVDS